MRSTRLKRAGSFLCVAALLLALMPLTAGALTMDEQVDQLFRRGKTTGGSLVIVMHGQIVYARDYGYKQLSRREPVDERTYFRLSSVTKLISGVGAMQLVERGLLDLDQDISAYFGYEIKNPYYPNIPLTLRQAMSHTLSVSEGGGYSGIRNTVRDMLDYSLKRRGNFLDQKPGDKYVYSNFGAGLVGAMMEAASGQSVNSYMRDNVFGPLGIDASYSASLLLDPQDVSGQYTNGKLYRAASNYINETYEDFADPERHYRTTVGDIWIRSRDLAKIAALLCGDGSFGDVRILQPESVQAMRTAQNTLGQSVTGESPYGLFMERNTFILPGRTVYGHQGMSKAAILNLYTVPESGFAMVITTNGSSLVRDHRVGVMALNMMRTLFPLFADQ